MGAISTPGRRVFSSGQQVITAAGALTIAHGLGVIPRHVLYFLVCVVAESNYLVGDVVGAGAGELPGYNTLPRGASVVADSVNLVVRFGSAANTFALIDKATGGVPIAITNANWKLILRAFE